MHAVFFVDVPHRLAGAQRSLLSVVERIHAWGVRPTVVSVGEGIFVDALRGAGLRVIVLPGSKSLMTFGKKLLVTGWLNRATIVVRELLPYNLALARLLRDQAVDLVHFNTPRGILIGGPAAKIMRCPTVMHLRGRVPFGPPFWPVAQILANRIVLVARALEREVSATFRPVSRVVHNGVAIPDKPRDQAQARKTLASQMNIPLDDRPLFVTLSSPVPFKGLHHLLEAAALTRKKGRPLRIICAGSGDNEDYLRWLRTKCSTLSLGDSVHFVGYVKRPLDLVAAADAVVLPSVEQEQLRLDEHRVIRVSGNEGLPRSILEAMSLGVPVVSSNIAGVSEQVVDGETGLLVPPGDPQQLATALQRVATDLAWRQAAGKAARARAKNAFSLQAATNGLDAVFHELVPHRRDPRFVNRHTIHD